MFDLVDRRGLGVGLGSGDISGDTSGCVGVASVRCTPADESFTSSITGPGRSDVSCRLRSELGRGARCLNETEASRPHGNLTRACVGFIATKSTSSHRGSYLECLT